MGQNGQSVTSFDTQHGFTNLVQLKRNSGMGSGSLLLPGVTVHEGAMIGGGAVVTKDIPANSHIVGTPAEVIKTFGQENYKL